ncbi:hypothetical protein SH601_14270 [Gracilibacillus sp. S3-1-1]|uniref:Uncharacterized protein n=1 Tax=Gracilibacillus pellucidus TaxID=3095368 RepID=A0ACC6M861_9BACI|nr:hypothetical protein [Gracilibacillus sp. S3-1-1]MDX8047154.1 hypothetical protein [Gracilibacillus sp. S3-1-1]
METKEVNMILQAIKEVSEKVDENQHAIKHLDERVTKLDEKLTNLNEKVDKNHQELSGRLDKSAEKWEFLYTKYSEHDQDIYRLKKEVF